MIDYLSYPPAARAASGYRVLNETHALLIAHARSIKSITVAGTIRQLTERHEFLHAKHISERTFKRHIRQLLDSGIVAVRHTKRRTWYTLLRDEIEVPVYEQVHVRPGVYDLRQTGTEIIRYQPEPDPVPPCFDDIDLDALEATWPVNPDNAWSHGVKVTVIAA